MDEQAYLERLGCNVTKRSCQNIIHDLWSSLGNEKMRAPFEKHVQTLETLPESSEWDSHKPEYYVQLAIVPIWNAARSLATKSSHAVLSDWTSGMFAISGALDGLITVNIGHDSPVEDTEIQYERDVFQFLQNRQELDKQTIADLRARSVQMSDSYRVAIEEIAQTQAWK